MRKLLVGSTILVGSGFWANAAMAQTPDLVEEIVVTSRKTQERLLDVPLAITAFTAEAIDKLGIASLEDVASQTPGLTFISILGESLPTPVIRGVAPTSLTGEPGASVFIDGVFVSAREGLNFSELDLERIEVIKGPQSAVYGRNSFSGAVNFITARPTDTWLKSASATVGTHKKFQVKGVISGPVIGDKLGMRLAYGHDEFGGSYKNLQAGGGDVGGYNYDTVQGRLALRVTDELTIDLNGYASHDRIDPAAVLTFLPNCEDTNRVLGLPGVRFREFCGPVPEKSDRNVKVNNQASGGRREVYRVNGLVTWQTDAGTLTSTTAYSKVRYRSKSDYLGDRGNGGQALLYNTTANTVGVFLTGQISEDIKGTRNREFSEELRFQSSPSEPVRYSLGSYYYDSKNRTPLVNFGLSEPVPRDFVSYVSGASFAGFFTNNPNPGESRHATVKAIAGFGSLDVDITDALTARGEARYTAEDKGFLNFSDLNPLTRTRNRTWSNWTWRGTLDYKFSDDQMIYATVAHGEKAGDFSAATDSAAPGRPLYVLPYDGEKIKAYEIGAKGLLLNRKLAVEISAFHYDWNDVVLFQGISSDPRLPAFVSPELFFFVNSGNVNINGLELAATYQLVEGLSVDLRGTVTDAEIEKNDKSTRTFLKALPSFAPNGDVGGNQSQRQAKWQGNLAVQYKTALTQVVDGFIRADVNYKGKQFTGDTNLSWVPSRTLVNVRMGVEMKDVALELWGRNLLNDRSANSVIGQTFIGNTEMQADGSYRADPVRFANTVNARRFDATLSSLREFGLTVRAKF